MAFHPSVPLFPSLPLHLSAAQVDRLKLLLLYLTFCHPLVVLGACHELVGIQFSILHVSWYLIYRTLLDPPTVQAMSTWLMNTRHAPSWHCIGMRASIIIRPRPCMAQHEYTAPPLDPRWMRVTGVSSRRSRTDSWPKTLGRRTSTA